MLEAVECVFSECISIPKSYLGVVESKSWIFEERIDFFSFKACSAVDLFCNTYTK